MSGSADIVNRPVVICRGKFAPRADDGEIGPPGSGATITLWDQTLDSPFSKIALPGVQMVMHPFSRVQLSIFSSHDSAANGIVYTETHDDGTNFDTASTQTFSNAAGFTTFDFACRGGHPKLTYQNSASVLTAWRFTLTGIIGDRSVVT